MARRTNPSNVQHTNAVQNAAFYTNLLESKTSNILKEMERLRSDIGDEDVRRTLETKFENSFKQVQELERQLADVNLAKDKARSGMSHEDVRRQTHALQARNKRLEKEVDEIFLARRKTEDEVAKLHLEMRKMHQGFEHQKLLSEIESIHEEERVEEEKIGQLFHRMKAIESSSPLAGQDSSFSTPNELIHMGDAPLQNEIKDLITEQRELRSRLRALKGGAAIELLDRMEEVDTLLSNTSDEKAQLENYLLSLTSAIESLREEISAAEMLSKCHLPSRNEVQLMQEVSYDNQTTSFSTLSLCLDLHVDWHLQEVAFTNGQLEINQDTIKRLQQQKLARMEELERVRHLEKRMEAEMNELAKCTKKMKIEMKQYDLDALREDSAARREDLADRCDELEQRQNRLNGMMSNLRVDYEDQMKSSGGGGKWVSFDENNTKLQRLVRAVRELQDKMNHNNVTYSERKTECLQLVQTLNSMILKRNEEL
jgi:hypothetical protein